MISFVMNNNITVNLFHPMLYNNSNYSVCIPSYATIMCVLVRVCSISIVVITLCVFLPICYNSSSSSNIILLCVCSRLFRIMAVGIYMFTWPSKGFPLILMRTVSITTVVYQRKCKCYCCYGDGVTLLPWLQCWHLNAYKRRRINNKVNLLTGTSEVTPPPVSVAMVTLI